MVGCRVPGVRAFEEGTERLLLEHASVERLGGEQDLFGDAKKCPPHPPVKRMVVAIAVNVEPPQNGIQFVESKLLKTSGAGWRPGIWISNFQISRLAPGDERLVNVDAVPP